MKIDQAALWSARYAEAGEDYLFGTALLEKDFSGWEMLELREHEDELAEGTGHQGRSALIDLVARKPH